MYITRLDKYTNNNYSQQEGRPHAILQLQERGIPCKIGRLTDVSELIDASINCRLVIYNSTELSITFPSTLKYNFDMLTSCSFSLCVILFTESLRNKAGVSSRKVASPPESTVYIQCDSKSGVDTFTSGNISEVSLVALETGDGNNS